MVMMEKPSPIQVGREFVRQYYTLLNKAPDMLYRFYSMKSSYVHGGRYCDGEPETSVIGQKEINTKIKSLEFRDCHTKIRQVDAHSTVGSGVVVQVTGELSNCGQPLRRFMQTFVLAPQGDNPFKFYVHNDIFRYQDEVFNDEPQTRSDVDDEQEFDEETTEQDILPESSPQVPIDNFYNASPNPLNPPSPPVIMSNGLEQEPQHVECERVRTPSPALPEQTIEIPSPVSSPIPQQQEQLTTPQQVDQQTHIVEEQTEPEMEPQEPEPTPKPTSPPKPISWAHLASKNTPVVRGNTQQGTSIRVNQPEVVAAAEPVDPAPRTNTRGGGGARPRGNREEDRGGFGRNPNNGGGREPSGVRYPDNQQIFVGNLPYDISDNDLKEHFSTFGSVLEVRINHSHTNNPSFGFIIFEEAKSVVEVLDRMPTQFRNHRINIEEKKHRGSRDNNRRPGPGDARRGPMGDMKGNRRGQGGAQMMKRDRQGPKEVRSEGQRQAYNNGARR